jgi:hypothetical protein
MRRQMSGLVTLGVIAVALVGWHRSQAVERCPMTVDFGGITYRQATTTEEVISGKELGDGTLHGCGSYQRPVALNRTPGIDPHIAVASPMAAHVLYLAPGVTPQDLSDRFGTVSLDE